MEEFSPNAHVAKRAEVGIPDLIVWVSRIRKLVRRESIAFITVGDIAIEQRELHLHGVHRQPVLPRVPDEVLT